MSTEQHTDNRNILSVSQSKELKPLHQTWLFWTIITATFFAPIFTAHIILPIECWDLLTLKKGTEVFKTPLVIGGACLSALTIYSLAYRSMETNRQIRISTLQYRHSIHEPLRHKNEELELEFHSAKIHLIRIKRRLTRSYDTIERYINDLSGSSPITQLKLEAIQMELESQLSEIKELSTDLFEKHTDVISRTPTASIELFDGHIINITSMSNHLKIVEKENLSAVLTTIKDNFNTDFADELYQEIRKLGNEVKKSIENQKTAWI